MSGTNKNLSEEDAENLRSLDERTVKDYAAEIAANLLWWKENRALMAAGGVENRVAMEPDKPHKSRPWGYKGKQSISGQ